MIGNLYKVIDNVTGNLKLPVTVTDGVYENNVKLSEILDKVKQPFIRFRMLHWNVGHWAKGNSGSSTVTPSTYEDTKKGFHKVFNDYAPDVVGCCEYSSIFYHNGSTTTYAHDDIFGQYLDYYIGTERGYSGTAFFANYPIVGRNEIELENGNLAIEMRVQLSKDKQLVICECHLPWNQEIYQQNSLDILINRYANEEYVIIAGDMNMYKNNEYKTINKLTAAGYQNANWGYLGKILTSYNNVICSNYLDSIAVKGGSILQTQVLQNTPSGCDPDNPNIQDEALWDAVNLSDHFPMICDIEFPL